MLQKKLIVIICLLSFSALILSGCGPKEVEVTEIEQIVGVWQGETFEGNSFVMAIENDGTMKLAVSEDSLREGRTDTYQLWVEDDLVNFHFPVFCSEGDGQYKAVILPGGNLKFSVVDDPCDYRISRMDRSLPGALKEYVVEFSPLDYE